MNTTTRAIERTKIKRNSKALKALTMKLRRGVAEQANVSVHDVRLTMQDGELVAVHKCPQTNAITAFNFTNGGTEQ